MDNARAAPEPLRKIRAMQLDAGIRKRVEELIERGSFIARSKLQYADPAGKLLIYESEGWIASALHILQVIFPDALSPHRARATALVLSTGKVGMLTAVLQAVLLDVDAGVLTTVAGAARSEVFDDFLDHAEHYLKGNRPGPAGVIAGVVFEDTIRRACEKHGIAQKKVDLDQLITALEKKELLTPVKAKRCRVAAAVRTSATHAQWDEFEHKDVAATIETTRELIDKLLDP